MPTDEYFENLSEQLREDAEEFILQELEHLKEIAERLIRNPRASVNLSREEQELIRRWIEYNEKNIEWVDATLPKAYKKGLSEADRAARGASMQVGAFTRTPLLSPAIQPGELSREALKALADVPEHHSMYQAFQQAAYEDFAATRLPVVRSKMDKVRALVVEASDQVYREADSLTRRQLSQQIIRRLTDEGITGIQYANGRTAKLDTYTEMVARSQTGNASRQAHMSRLQEYGRDLVLISQHYPVSPLCEPWQGRVFSISGDSDNYPSLEEAISGGLYHSNCKHSQSGYNPGQKIPEAREATGKRENRQRYEAQKQQRYNERQIRGWKRRETTALTDREREKAAAKVREWQKKQRDHLDSNSFLRRKYDREQI